jgi:hypothetical protein
MHATQAPLPGSEIVLIGAITSAVVIAQATWPLVQHFEVMWLCGTLTAVVIGTHWMLFPTAHPMAHVAPR